MPQKLLRKLEQGRPAWRYKRGIGIGINRTLKNKNKSMK
jgi:hypothetical protein